MFPQPLTPLISHPHGAISGGICLFPQEDNKQKLQPFTNAEYVLSYAFLYHITYVQWFQIVRLHTWYRQENYDLYAITIKSSL